MPPIQRSPVHSLADTLPPELDEMESFYPAGYGETWDAFDGKSYLKMMEMEPEEVHMPPPTCHGGPGKTYTDLHQAYSSKQHSTDVFQLQDPSFLENLEREGDLTKWTMVHPECWTTDEVLDWLYWVIDVSGMDGHMFHGERFNDITGKELLAMTEQEFLRREPTYGTRFYQIFQSMLAQSDYSPPQEPQSGPFTPSLTSTVPPRQSCRLPSMQEFMEPSILDLSQHAPEYCQLPDMSSSQFQSYVTESAEVTIGGKSYRYPLDITDDFPEISEESDYDSESTDSRLSCSHGSGTMKTEYAPVKTQLPSVTGPTAQVGTVRPPGKRPPGRPRKNANLDGHYQSPMPRGRKQGQTSKGNHLWEFVRDLLKSPAYNPGTIRWEDKTDGVFRFVRSAAIAQMWGKKKNNPLMTYEKLSRAMRFCRTAGYFSALPKNGKFPKKLCFRFGHKASGWLDS